MYKIENIETGDCFECAEKPVWLAGVWECGTFRITDVDRNQYRAIEPEHVTPAEIRRAEIEAELTVIDADSARPLRAILAATISGGTADPADVAKLSELEAQAVALREELAALQLPAG